MRSLGACIGYSVLNCSCRRHFFYGRRGGTFLELGGYNGCAFSNTLLLEAGAGWRVCLGSCVQLPPAGCCLLCEAPHDFLTLLHAVLQGILIEASPSHSKGMAAARPAATCVHAAVCNASSVVHYADAGDQRARRTQTGHVVLCILSVRHQLIYSGCVHCQQM